MRPECNDDHDEHHDAAHDNVDYKLFHDLDDIDYDHVAEHYYDGAEWWTIQ